MYNHNPRSFIRTLQYILRIGLYFHKKYILIPFKLFLAKKQYKRSLLTRGRPSPAGATLPQTTCATCLLWYAYHSVTAVYVPGLGHFVTSVPSKTACVFDCLYIVFFCVFLLYVISFLVMLLVVISGRSCFFFFVFVNRMWCSRRSTPEAAR